jgi:Spy/CpxP family protein refolding chaperone
MKSTLKAGLILTTVFAIGVMVGVEGIRITQKRVVRTPRDEPVRSGEAEVQHIAERLTEKYNLTEDQQVVVRAILQEAQKKYDAFFDSTRPAFEQIRREQREAIRAQMTPEQEVKFEAWIEERRKNHSQRDGEGPRPNGDYRQSRGPGARPDGPPPAGIEKPRK